MLPQT